ncbi:hypothetical protein [Stetteria hydrogenophila]
MGRVLVASLGFTVDFVLRRVADLGRGGVSRLLGVALYTDEGAWRRVEASFALLKRYLEGVGVGAELHRVTVGGLVREARDALARAYSLAGGDGVVEVFITGGPRILGAALAVAALTSSREVRDRLVLTAYGEGFEARLEVEVGRLARLLCLDEQSQAILRELAGLGEARAEELRLRLGLKRSTLYKKLKDLQEAGLAESAGGRWRLHPSLEPLL